MLPKQLLWLAVVAPLLIGPLPSAAMGDASWSVALRGTLSLYLPFIAIPTTLVVFYHRAAPRLLLLIPRRSLRIAFHFTATAAIAAVIGVLLYRPLSSARA